MPFGSHTLLLSLEGALFAFGRNEEGQLGLGHKDHQLKPTEVSWNGPQPVQVDCGWQHSLVLDAEGGVWDAGCSRSSSLTFQEVLGLPCIVLVAAGDLHSAAIDREGGLWVWTSRHSSWANSVPQRLKGLPPLIKVACGNYFLVAEAEEGLWVLGNNSFGQLGLGHTDSVLQPTFVQVENCSQGPLRCLAVFYEGVILIDSQGGVFSSGGNLYGQLGRSSGDASKLQQVDNIPPMLAASCGKYHTLCLDENGNVWAWGCGKEGQLGTGTTSNKRQPTLVPSLKGISALVAGMDYSLAFPQEGGLLVFGSNYFGQLGLESSTKHPSKRTTPTRSALQPALPHSFTRSRKKSARFL